MDRILVEDLAHTPVRNWTRLQKQNQLICEFIESGAQGVPAVNGFASQMKIEIRSFYRLVAAYRRRLAGDQKRVAQNGLAPRIGAIQEEIVSEALTNLSHTATITQVYDEAVRLARLKGALAPTMHAVRSRYRAAPGEFDLTTCLTARCDWVIDACPLGINLKSPTGAVVPAVLLCLIEALTGRVAQHRVIAGEISPTDVTALLAHGVRPQKSARSIRLGYTPLFGPHRDVIASALNNKKARLIEIGFARSTPYGLHDHGNGEAVFRVFGRKIGRIPLRPRGPGVNFRSTPVVGKRIAAAVIAELVDDRNGVLNWSRAV